MESVALAGVRLHVYVDHDHRLSAFFLRLARNELPVRRARPPRLRAAPTTSRRRGARRWPKMASQRLSIASRMISETGLPLRRSDRLGLTGVDHDNGLPLLLQARPKWVACPSRPSSPASGDPRHVTQAGGETLAQDVRLQRGEDEPETLPPPRAVGREAPAIQGEDVADVERLGQQHQRRVGEVHWKCRRTSPSATRPRVAHGADTGHTPRFRSSPRAPPVVERLLCSSRRNASPR